MPHLEFISLVIPYVTISKYLLDLLEYKYNRLSIYYKLHGTNMICYKANNTDIAT